MENPAQEITIRFLDKAGEVSIFALQGEKNIRYHDSMGGEFDTYISHGSTAEPYITMSKEVFEALKKALTNG